MFYEKKQIHTSRLTVAYYHAGQPGGEKLMLVHGNASSSAVYLSVMKRLEDRYEIVAPDLRGFGDTEVKPIDATRGMRDFSDDLDAFAVALGWEKFFLLGWSMGGGAVMQYAIDHSEKLSALALVGSLSPFGFGGTYGEDGKKLEPLGLASGGGCANAQLIESLQRGDREFASKTIDVAYVAPPFQIEAALKEKIIDGVLSTRIGDGLYPGDKKDAAVWPFFAAGEKGVNNTMAPNWCDLSPLADIPNHPPILWLRGASDTFVSDNSMFDIVNLGRLGFVPGYPGEDVCPPQPMLRQTRYVLEKYKANGGSYDEVVIDGGHGPFLDNEDGFIEALLRFLGANGL